MKKTPIEAEASAPWRAALVRFDEDLRRRGAAEKTRSAYAADLRQFAVWASCQHVEPAAVSHRLAPPRGRPRKGPQRRRRRPAPVRRRGELPARRARGRQPPAAAALRRGAVRT